MSGHILDEEWALLTSKRLRHIGREYLSHGIMSGDRIAYQEILCICEELLDRVGNRTLPKPQPQGAKP